jgi:superoxide dismutase, Fe-Mn family
MTNLESNRRDFLTATATGAASLLVANTVLAQATQESSMSNDTAAPAFAAAHQPKPLPFDAGKLKGLSAKLIESHWSNNYGGSVKTLNTVKQQLAQALAVPDTPPFVYNGLKREHLLRSGSVVLHELYFENLGGNGQADADMRSTIAKHFGTFDRWETEFRKIAQGLGGGSGWVVLGYNTHLNTVENYWLSDHLHYPAGSVPLLVMDMYEHSYQMDYGAAAAKYIDAFFQNINWTTVDKRWTAMKPEAKTA